jgi:FAD/FMN-containing dehydrogenase
MANIVDARRALVARILDSEGRASPTLRRAAFDNTGLAEPLATLVEKVAKRAKAHSAVAERAYQDRTRVAAALANLDTAPIGEPLRATLRMLGKLTRQHTVDPDDMRAVLAAGGTRAQIEDALAVGLAFNVTDRLADSFAFSVPGPKAFAAGAKFLLARGYR